MASAKPAAAGETEELDPKLWPEPLAPLPQRPTIDDVVMDVDLLIADHDAMANKQHERLRRRLNKDRLTRADERHTRVLNELVSKKLEAAERQQVSRMVAGGRVDDVFGWKNVEEVGELDKRVKQHKQTEDCEVVNVAQWAHKKQLALDRAEEADLFMFREGHPFGGSMSVLRQSLDCSDSNPQSPAPSLPQLHATPGPRTPMLPPVPGAAGSPNKTPRDPPFSALGRRSSVAASIGDAAPGSPGDGRLERTQSLGPPQSARSFGSLPPPSSLRGSRARGFASPAASPKGASPRGSPRTARKSTTTATAGNNKVPKPPANGGGSAFQEQRRSSFHLTSKKRRSHLPASPKGDKRAGGAPGTAVLTNSPITQAAVLQLESDFSMLSYGATHVPLQTFVEQGADYTSDYGNRRVVCIEFLEYMRTNNMEDLPLVGFIYVVQPMWPRDEIAPAVRRWATKLGWSVGLPPILASVIHHLWDTARKDWFEGHPVISFDSFLGLVNTERFSLDLNEVLIMFYATDDDGNGVLDKSEFAQFLSGNVNVTDVVIPEQRGLETPFGGHVRFVGTPGTPPKMSR